MLQLNFEIYSIKYTYVCISGVYYSIVFIYSVYLSTIMCAYKMYTFLFCNDNVANGFLKRNANDPNIRKTIVVLYSLNS